MRTKTRRWFLLASVFAGAASPILSDSYSQNVQSNRNRAKSFEGNPNINVSAINTRGGIVCSRTTGQTPCFIQASASAITAEGTSSPYEDLAYSWHFGDPEGSELFTNPITGKTVNANSDQRGPEAVYCYRKAGIYTLTLSIKGKSAIGFASAQVTTLITVVDFAASGGDWYFDSTAAGGGKGTIASPFNDLATLNEKATRPNTRINIKRGSSWNGTAGIKISRTPIRISAYGSGPDPQITVNGSQSACFMQNGSGSSPVPQEDIVISNLRCISASGFSGEWLFALNGTANLTANIKNAYMDNCSTQHTIYGQGNVGFQGRKTHVYDNFGFWGGSIKSGAGPTLGNRVSLYADGSNWFFVFGCNISGAGSDQVLDHHIYPNVKTHSLYKWISFGEGPNKNYCINTNWDGASPMLEYVDYILISECDMTGTLRAHDLGNANNDPTLTQYRNVVVEGCNMHKLPGDGVILYACGLSVTERDNNIWDCEGGRLFVPLFTGGVNRVYRNKIHRTNGSRNGAAFSWTNGSWKNAQVFTDNVIVDTEKSAVVVSLKSSDQTGSVIDFNQYYAPNDQDHKFLLNDGKAITFPAWQGLGFDKNGFTGNPNWTDAEHGNFD